jgi:L-amino acid N-acyltransferase YncA
VAAPEVPRDVVPGLIRVTGQQVGICIRGAADADLPAMAAILNQEIAASPFVYAEEVVTLKERRRWLDAHRAAELPVLVATEHDLVLGWASLSPYRGSSGYRFTAEASVYVAPAARRRGVAAGLLGALIDAHALQRFHAFVASIDAENAPSIALFERFGFSEAARLPDVGRKFGEWRTQLLFLRVQPEPRAYRDELI